MSGPMAGIWFGILVVKMAEFCLITPPIGLNCFVVAGVRDDLSVQDVFKGVTPFFIAEHGTVTSAKVITDRQTNRSRGFGFVEMSDGGENAIQALNDAEVDGRKLVVNESRPRD